MNTTIELIQRHGSTRKYHQKPVSSTDIETIVSAGQRASSSSNLQSYSIISVTSPTKRGRLARLCGDQQHIAEAPVFLAFCADLARMDRICRLRGYTQIANYTENFLIATIDAAIVAQNTALAAQSMGLGICFIGAIRNNPREVIKLLKLPKLVFPITGMTVGHATDQPRIRPRLPLREILHKERYHRPSDKALLEYDQAMIKTGIYNQRQVPNPKNPGEFENYGWMEHSSRRSSQVVRPFLREILKECGFELK